MTTQGLPSPLARLIENLERLPGIGLRTAERLAFHLLRVERPAALELAQAIRSLREELEPCRECQNISVEPLCPICADSSRDRRLLMVVESPKDLAAFERSGHYRGYYHVLHQKWSPLDGTGLEGSATDRVLARIERDAVKEVILATNPDAEGDGTALALEARLRRAGVPVTRLARGLARGTSIEYAAPDILLEALEGRRAQSSSSD